MSKEKEIKIKIDQETLKKLLEQLEQMKRVNVPGIETCNTIEDLVSFYIKQMFRVDSILMEGVICILKKYIGNDKFQQIFKDIVEPPKNIENTENTSFGSLYDEEEDEDMDDEFYYYDDDEEFEDNGKLEMVDINSEEYKARQRKDEEEKKKNKK